MAKTASKNKTGGSRFDPKSGNLYFIASDISYSRKAIAKGLVKSILIAFPSLKEKDLPLIEEWADTGISVMLDSGVYSLAQKMAKEKGLTQTQAFGLAPEEVTGYEKLKTDYITTIKRFEKHIWGYVEIDFGGMENKKRVRAELEAEGLRPIPVYHPFNDPYEYFDELASTYDRICIGNIVYAEPSQRVRIIHALTERKRQYEPLWIHLLGHTPNVNLYTYPMNSCDSSSWLSGSRHGSIAVTGGGFNIGNLSREFIYKIGDGENLDLLVNLMSYTASFLQDEWQIIENDKLKLATHTIRPTKRAHAPKPTPEVSKKE